MNSAWKVLSNPTHNYGRYFSLKSTTVLQQDMKHNPGKPTESSIASKLAERLKPEHLEVINESFMHNVPKGSETHFKVVVVSQEFENVSLLQRHRVINELLQDELAGGVHALSIVVQGQIREREDRKETWPLDCSTIKEKLMGIQWQNPRASGRAVTREWTRAQPAGVALGNEFCGDRLLLVCNGAVLQANVLVQTDVDIL